MGGFDLGNCIPFQVDKLWAQVPYNLTSNTVIGIQNVIMGPCDASLDTSTSTLLNLTQLPANTAFGWLGPYSGAQLIGTSPPPPPIRVLLLPSPLKLIRTV